MYRIYVTDMLDKKAMDYLYSFADVQMASSNKEADQVAEIGAVDAIISRGARMYNSVVKAAADKGNLKVVVRHAAGLDTVDIPFCTDLGIAVCNCPGANANSTAEQAVALALAINKNIVRIDKAYRNGAFTLGKPLASRKEELGFINHELKGKVAGIIGYGRIGREIAKKISGGFDMKVTAFDPFQYGKDILPEGGFWSETLDDLLKVSDLVFVVAPYTGENQNMISTHEFETMKESAMLINDGRGELVDEDALYEALRTHKIAGAALDMLAVEPPKEHNKLFDLPNIIVTPHCGSATFEATETLSMMAVESTKLFLDGGEPEGWVNKAKLGK